MNGATAVRKEIHAFIDALPDSNLYALKPLLALLVDEAPVVETDLTDEEKAIIAAGRQRFREHPEQFVPLESVE